MLMQMLRVGGALNLRSIHTERKRKVSLCLLPSATKLGQGNVFTGVCDSVNRRGLLPGVPGPGGSAPRWGGLVPGGSAPGGWCLVETPPRQPLLRMVRILLECILVVLYVWSLSLTVHRSLVICHSHVNVGAIANVNTVWMSPNITLMISFFSQCWRGLPGVRWSLRVLPAVDGRFCR